MTYYFSGNQVVSETKRIVLVGGLPALKKIAVVSSLKDSMECCSNLAYEFLFRFRYVLQNYFGPFSSMVERQPS